MATFMALTWIDLVGGTLFVMYLIMFLGCMLMSFLGGALCAFQRFEYRYGYLHQLIGWCAPVASAIFALMVAIGYAGIALDAQRSELVGFKFANLGPVVTGTLLVLISFVMSWTVFQLIRFYFLPVGKWFGELIRPLVLWVTRNIGW